MNKPTRTPLFPRLAAFLAAIAPVVAASCLLVALLPAAHAQTTLGGGGDGWHGGGGGAGRVVMRYLGTSGVTSGGSSSAIAGTDWQVVQFTTTGTSSLSDTLSFTTGTASLVATQSGAISGTGSLTYDSPGTLTLGAANTHTGSTFVKAGTLNLGHVNALQNSTLDLRAADAGAIGFTVAGVTMSGGVMRNGGLTTSSVAATAGTIDGVTTSYTGGNPISTAARRAGGGGAGAGGNGTNAAANTGGTGGVGIASAISGTTDYYGGGGGGGAEYAGSTPTPGAGGLGGGGRGAGNVSGKTGFSASVAGTPNTGGGGGGPGGVNNVASGYNGAAGGSGVVIMRYAGPQIATGGTVSTVGDDTVHTFTSASGALTFTSTPTARLDGVVGGAGGFTWSSFGDLTLGGANTYAGGTTVSAGTLRGTTASLQGGITNDATVEFSQATDGEYAGVIGGTGGLVKSDSGRVTLSGASTFAGAITGTVALQNGSTLAPGNSIESLASGTATFAAAATYAYEVDSTDLGALGTAADLLVVSGDLNLDPGNGTLLTFTDLANTPQPFVEDTTIFALFNYSSTWNGGLFTSNGTVLTDGSRFSVGSQLWEIDYNRTSAAGLDNFTANYLPSSSFVTVTAVPEPTTLVLVGVGGAILASVARGRKG